MQITSHWKWWICSAILSLLIASNWCSAQIPVYGGPSQYDGYFTAVVPVYVNNNGIAAGGTEIQGAGARPIEFASIDLGGGKNWVELQNFGTQQSSSSTSMTVSGINNNNSISGWGDIWNVSTQMGTAAAVWPGPGYNPAVTQLGDLGSTTRSFPTDVSTGINASGVISGYAEKFDSGNDLGARPVKWNGTGAAIELNILGDDGTGFSDNNYALAINSGGTIVGSVSKYDNSGNFLGSRGVRWASGGTAVTELDNLGTATNGHTNGSANAINSAGVAVGKSDKYDAPGNFLGSAAVRWSASSTAVTELNSLGTDINGRVQSEADAINDFGATVGQGTKYDASTHANLGNRVIRWDANSATAHELQPLSTNLSGVGDTDLGDGTPINAGGYVVGDSQMFSGNSSLGFHAVYWDPLGNVVDLNSLIDPTSGWVLTEADSISDTGWIAGAGTYYDPTIDTPDDAVSRLFLLQVPTAVPEPVSAAAVILGLVALRRRR